MDEVSVQEPEPMIHSGAEILQLCERIESEGYISGLEDEWGRRGTVEVAKAYANLLLALFPDEAPEIDGALESEAFVAGSLSTMPPFASHHPAYALPFAKRALEALGEWEPSE